MATVTETATPREPPGDTQPIGPAKQVAVEQPDQDGRATPVQDMPPVPSQPPPLDTKEEGKPTMLGEQQIRLLFAGAPHFHIADAHGRSVPLASYPWDVESSKEGGSDSVQLTEPAFRASTLRYNSTTTQGIVEEKKRYVGYIPDIVELPSMLGSQGIEPGTVGLPYFLELPVSDSLITDLDQSRTSKDYLEAMRNKELIQTSPERLGIRPVALDLIYDRLVEFQDIYEAFQDTPEPMTILNNQSSGDLYANLFSKFLTPPGFDDSTEDPTGLQMQIMVLLRILKLKGVWYDFGLVEWRIRLGQVLWSDPEPVPENESRPLWTERDLLVLQITLACELLLRLDVFTNADVDDAAIRLKIGPEVSRGFLKMKNRKIDWDLTLARRFLENISVMKGSDAEGSSMQPKSRGLLSLLSGSAQQDSPRSDLVLLPQHQAQQLAGLLHFAKALHWPEIDDVLKDLASKLGVHANDAKDMVPQSPLSGGSFDPTTPSCVSVYATPLHTPLPASHVLDSYFGQIGRPNLNRHDSRSLRVPLSPTWASPTDQTEPVLDRIGGWLSRSYLTGLVLPGEAISHFLISTLLENDKSAIITLGDSANLYGGFTYQDRTWWSKNSIVGRVLACVEGSAECMGWISCPKLPARLTGWHSIHSEQLPYEDRLHNKAGHDMVAQESAIVAGETLESVKSEDLVLPTDSLVTPASSLSLTTWELTPINPDLIDDDNLSGPPTESDILSASFTFSSREFSTSHILTLAYDVQFVTSWPCTPPASAASPVASLPYILKRSRTGTLSRSSSKRSVTLSRRSSHGYEPLLSHPPASADIAPKRMYDADPEDALAMSGSVTQSKPMNAHPLHKSYLYQIVPVADVLDPDFQLPFAMHTSKSTERLLSSSAQQVVKESTIENNKKTILILDARTSSDMELLARSWCAERGLHALVGRAGRTCLACCIREARGLGIHIVIRV